MEVPRIIKNRITILSSNSTTGYLSKENENTNSKRHMHPHDDYNIIYNIQDSEKPKSPSMNEWIRKIHTHRILFSHKN